jgi:hypothetical protein
MVHVVKGNGNQPAARHCFVNRRRSSGPGTGSCGSGPPPDGRGARRAVGGDWSDLHHRAGRVRCHGPGIQPSELGLERRRRGALPRRRETARTKRRPSPSLPPTRRRLPRGARSVPRLVSRERGRGQRLERPSRKPSGSPAISRRRSGIIARRCGWHERSVTPTAWANTYIRGNLAELALDRKDWPGARTVTACRVQVMPSAMSCSESFSSAGFPKKSRPKAAGSHQLTLYLPRLRARPA